MSKVITRRRLLKTGSAALGLGVFAPAIIGRARAQSFPARNMSVVIPTNQGGGVETNARNFGGVWRNYLGVEFEYEFFPGAGGQAGYEVYVHRKERDGHNLLFGNMTPELIMYATQNPNYRIPEDVTYVASIAGNPTVLYVGAESPFQTIEDLVEEGRRRPINISTSRLPHPATIGAFALADGTGAEFNLIPFAGGGPTSMAAITGEVDAAVLTAGVAISLEDQVRVLCTFKKFEPLDVQMGNPPSANEAFGLEIPDLDTATAYAIHTEAWENAEIRERLVTSIEEVFQDPALKEAYNVSGYPWESVEYQDADRCAEIVSETLELAERYRDLITG